MTGYVRKDTTNNIADGNVINAADLDAEFDGVKDAFQASTGHKHDGTTGEGAPITSLGPNQDVTISATLLAPKTTNTVDIGSSALKFKDLFLAGNGSVGGTLAVTGVATLTANPVLSAGTANGVAYLNGSKVVTSGSTLVFDSSNRLSVNQSSSLFGAQLEVTGGAVGQAIGIHGRASDGIGVLQFGANGASTEYARIQSDNTSSLQFGVGSSGTEQMRLTSTGLGIGTSSPAYKLEVNGQIGCSDNFVFTTANPAIVVNSGYLRVFTGGSERMRIDSSGNLGLGVTPSASNIPSIQSSFGIFTGNNQANIAANAYYNNQWNYTSTAVASLYTQTAGQHRFFTAASGTAGNAITFTQAMSLTAAGDLLVGTTDTTVTNGAFVLYGSGVINSYLKIGHKNGSNSGADFVACYYNGTQIGGVSQNGTTAVAFNTSSDYRLKNTIAPMTGALAKVALLKPVTYKWNADGSDGDGFIAHELAEVCPHAVTGEKDAVDADGNPKYQGIDTSFLVATLTAALQELNAKFDAYVASHP